MARHISGSHASLLAEPLRATTQRAQQVLQQEIMQRASTYFVGSRRVWSPGSPSSARAASPPGSCAAASAPVQLEQAGAASPGADWLFQEAEALQAQRTEHPKDRRRRIDAQREREQQRSGFAHEEERSSPLGSSSANESPLASRFAQSYPGNAFFRGARWLTEPLVVRASALTSVAEQQQGCIEPVTPRCTQNPHTRADPPPAYARGAGAVGV
jgi:hypothetical protein